MKYYRFIADGKIEKGFSLSDAAAEFARDAGFDDIFVSDGVPRVKDGFVSCAHCGNVAYIAFSDSPVGVDCERIKTPPPHISARLGISDPEEFFKKWTLGEAVAKASGVPLTAVLKDIGSFEKSYNIKYFEDDGVAVTVVTLKNTTEGQQ